MVAVLVKLRLALFKNGFARNTARAVGFVFGILFALGAAAGIGFGLVATRGLGPQMHRAIPILVLSISALMWIAMSLIAAGVDDSMEPGRFALFPLRARQLMPGMLIGSLLTDEGVLLTLIAIGLVWAWTTSLATAIAAGVAIVIGMLALMLTTRLITSALNSMVHSRSFRDVSFIIIVLAMSLSGLAIQFVSGMFQSKSIEEMGSMLGTPTTVLSWTPMGWAPAIPAAVDAGDWVGAGIRLVLLIAMTALLWRGWEFFLDKALTSPLEGRGTQEKVKANSWIDRFYPATPSGAVAARSLRYWRRDPRHLVGLAMIVMMPVLFIAPFYFQPEIPGMDRKILLIWAAAFMAWMVGAMTSSELSYDGSALATHILAGVSGKDDRIGRILAILTITGPLFLVLLFGGVAISGRWWMLPGAAGCALAILLCGLGAASFISTIWNVPSPPPGSNPFAKGSGGGVATWLNFFGVMLLTFVPAAPSIALAIISLTTKNMLWGWLSLAWAILAGGGILWLCIWLGGKRLETHWPEILKQVTYEG